MPLELYLLAYFVCVFLQYLGFYLFIFPDCVIMEYTLMTVL